MSNLVCTLQVDLGDRAYPIYIGSDLISNPEFFAQHIKGSRVMVVSNTTVAPLYLEQLKKALVDFNVSEVILPDGEEFKTLDVLNQIYTALLENRFDRTCTLIALGGGVVGDMTGYAAASYQRGVNFIQVPTTLLSQVDSSVGGKTGVNHPLGKNMIGAFHQPQAVIADTLTLNTLPDRELSAGMAEVIKYGLINDAEFFEWLEEHMEALMAVTWSYWLRRFVVLVRIKRKLLLQMKRNRANEPCSIWAIPLVMRLRRAWAMANGCMARLLVRVWLWRQICRVDWVGLMIIKSTKSMIC